MSQKPNIFLSYSSEDVRQRREFGQYLLPLKKYFKINSWDDDRISAGGNWKDQILAALDAAELVVFLISIESINSNFITDVEIAHALENSKLLYPVLLRDYPWEVVPWLNPIQIRPHIKPPTPIASLPKHKRERAYTQMTLEIRDLAFANGVGVQDD